MKNWLLGFACILSFQLNAIEYQLQLDTKEVSVVKVKMKPHEKIGLHRDAFPQVVIALKGGTITRLEADGSETQVDFPTYQAIFREADPENVLHKSINNSSEELELMIIQLKSKDQNPFSALLENNWQLGPFERLDEANPVITPNKDSVFHCPIQNRDVFWECDHTFNPAAVVRDGKVYLFYRAEDDYGEGIGNHTSRLGLAVSEDGIHFERSPAPIFFPDNDEQYYYEFPGGCEDPRIVETDEGTYVMTYTQWNGQVPVLGIATSDDLMNWKKHGYAFANSARRIWSKSGSIVCRREGDHLIATKIQGKYWMYWGEGAIFAATSEDLISWTPLVDEDDTAITILNPRDGKFDSLLVEAGPPAVITENGIVLLYNGKNSVIKGDKNITPKAYSAGQILIDIDDPTQVIARTEDHFLTPERPYEMKGQYQEGTVFIEGLVHFKDSWFLYYGTADSAIGVAKVKERR